MKKASLLKEKRAAKMAELQGIIQAARSENREMSTEEETRFDTLEQEIEAMNGQIARAERVEAMEAQAAANEARSTNLGENRSDTAADSTFLGSATEAREKQELVNQYRFLNVIRSQATKEGKLEGVELEMHQEAVKEARENGKTVEGVGVPAFFMGVRQNEQRDFTVATQGQVTVQTDLGNLIPALQPRLQVVSLGANVLGGLVGNLDIPRATSTGTATFKGEIDDADEDSEPFEDISLTPKRLTAFSKISKQMMIQNSFDIERFVRRRLEFAVAKGLDKAAINGSGVGNDPLGILNFSGIGAVAIDTNGGAIDRSHLVYLQRELEIDDVDMNNLAYLTNPQVKAALMLKKVDAGSGRFVWENRGELMSYNAAISTQIPSDLDKGTSTGTLSAMIFGNWNELLIGQWGGIDLVVDPYTLAKKAQIQLTINSFWDVEVNHVQSFAVIKDIDPNA